MYRSIVLPIVSVILPIVSMVPKYCGFDNIERNCYFKSRFMSIHYQGMSVEIDVGRLTKKSICSFLCIKTLDVSSDSFQFNLT